MPLSQLQGQLLRLLSSISVVPLFREHRRYFYVNDRTGASQWDFPAEEDKEDLKDTHTTQMQTTGQGDIKTSSTDGVTGQPTTTLSQTWFLVFTFISELFQ